MGININKLSSVIIDINFWFKMNDSNLFNGPVIIIIFVD